MSQRIAFLIDSYTGPWAGTERQLWYLLQGLDRNRFEPHLVLLRHSDYSGDIDPSSWPCPVHLVGVESLVSVGGIRGLGRLVRLLKRIEAGIVHAYFQDASILGPIAARLAGARFVAGRRDMGIWYTRANLRVLRLLAPLVDRVIANSHAVGGLVSARENITESRISVIYNGLEGISRSDTTTASLADRIPVDVPVIGIVANLRPVKRHADLVRAFARVRREISDAHLVIVGHGELEGALRAQAASLGVADQVHFLGRVEAPVEIIRRFSVGVLCSESEGLSNALMEYLREGIPVVCTDTGGNPELVTDGESGFLYPVGDEDALTERLVRLLRENVLAKSMGEAAARSVESMTMDNMVHGHMTVYEALSRDEGQKKS